MSNIEKIAIYDDRIVQNQMKYGISKGGASVSSASFSAIGSSTSQITFQVTAPSENVFIDRSFDWESDVYFSCQCDCSGTAGDVILKLGLDAALCQYPLNNLVTTMTATINDATVSQNNNDTLTEILRLCDTPANREMRTSPYMPDNYQNYESGYLTGNSPLNGYGSSFGSDYVPNGAFNGLVFTDASGNVLVGTTTYNDGTNTVNVVGGVPRLTGIPVHTSYKLFFKLTTVEKLVLSPFMFADSEHATGLFSIQNISFIMNMQSPSFTNTSGRLLRHTTARGRTLASIAYNTSVPKGVFQNTRIRCMFITPALSLPLPISNLVPYYEFPRYNTVLSLNSFTPKKSATVESQTITLSNIPDYLIIYVKPLSYGTTDADFYYPITGINLNFDNFNGLMSSHSQSQLYRISVMNGLHMDYQQFTGEARVSSQITGGVDNDIVPLTGGFIILRPGVDFQLSNGLAPGIIGNFTFQVRVGIYNQTSGTPTSANLWVIAASSGFFESKNGQSKVMKGASLTAEEVINANTPSTTSADLKRVIGGKFDFRSLLNTAISKAPDALKIGKIIAPHAKEFMPEEGKKIMSMAGMGSTGGARTGGARSLSSRLM